MEVKFETIEDVSYDLDAIEKYVYEGEEQEKWYHIICEFGKKENRVTLERRRDEKKEYYFAIFYQRFGTHRRFRNNFEETYDIFCEKVNRSKTRQLLSK